MAPWSAKFGLFIIAANVLAMIFAPALAPYSESEVVGDVWEPGRWGERWEEMNAGREAVVWLGTDHIGRDLFTRLLFGARNTISIALVTTILSFSVGSPWAFWRRHCAAGPTSC